MPAQCPCSGHGLSSLHSGRPKMQDGIPAGCVALEHPHDVEKRAPLGLGLQAEPSAPAFLRFDDPALAQLIEDLREVVGRNAYLAGDLLPGDQIVAGMGQISQYVQGIARRLVDHADQRSISAPPPAVAASRLPRIRCHAVKPKIPAAKMPTRIVPASG